MNRTYAAIEKLLELRTIVIAPDSAPVRWIESSQAMGLLGLSEPALDHLREWGWLVLSTGEEGMKLNSFCTLISLLPPSDDPLVIAFKSWVANEVLPSKARTGIYMLGQMSIVDHPGISDEMLKQSQNFCLMREEAQLMRIEAFSLETSADIWHIAAESMLETIA